MAKSIFQMIEMVNPKAVIIAKDCKINGVRSYWREGYLADYHEKNIEKYHSPAQKSTYYRFDNVIYPSSVFDGEITIGKKLNKKQIPEDLELVENWNRKESLSFTPKYKGNRGSDWVFETPRVKFTEMWDTLANDLTKIIPNCRVLEAELAEADCIAGVLTHKSPTTKHVLVTGDGDWHQLAINPNVKIMHHITMDILETTPEELEYDLKVKCVAGDRGDNINGTYIEGASGCLGAIKALKLVQEGREDKLFQPSLDRNRNLIVLSLDTIPKFVQANILAQLREGKTPLDPDYSWDNLGINKKERLILSKSENPLSQKYSATPANISGASLDVLTTAQSLDLVAKAVTLETKTLDECLHTGNN
jgi:hypothetical protein